MARTITARRLAPGVQITNELPDGRGGYAPTAPVTTVAAYPTADGWVLAEFDNGIAMRFQPGQRLTLATWKGKAA